MPPNFVVKVHDVHSFLETGHNFSIRYTFSSHQSTTLSRFNAFVVSNPQKIWTHFGSVKGTKRHKKIRVKGNSPVSFPYLA